MLSQLALVAIGLITTMILITSTALCAWATHEDRLTICSILGIKSETDQRLVSIRYGKLLLPFTWGRTSNIRIRVPVRAIPTITSPEEAVEAGIRLQQALNVDDSVTRMCKTRVREWRLS